MGSKNQVQPGGEHWNKYFDCLAVMLDSSTDLKRIQSTLSYCAQAISEPDETLKLIDQDSQVEDWELEFWVHG